MIQIKVTSKQIKLCVLMKFIVTVCLFTYHIYYIKITNSEIIYWPMYV